MKTSPPLSVVMPVRDEAAVLDELLERCSAAARRAARSWEIVLVDDASADGTASIMRRRSKDPSIRWVRLRGGRGQFGATQEGLRRARGGIVLVLDGDLQDPPERIPDFVRALRKAPKGTEIVFGIKSERDDPPWFMAAQWVFHALQPLLSDTPAPRSAGSFCLMSARLAAKIADVPLRDANLSACLAASGARFTRLRYRKLARYDRSSRVGPAGLAREAFGSLAVTGGLPRLAFASAVLACAALPGRSGGATRALRFAASGAAAALAASALMAHGRIRSARSVLAA